MFTARRAISEFSIATESSYGSLAQTVLERGRKAGVVGEHGHTMGELPTVADAVRLCRRLGDPSFDLSMLAEGNVSVRADSDTFWVKASGHSMTTLDESGMSRVRFGPILEAYDRDMGDSAVSELLLGAKLSDSPKPSVETFMHAWLLTLPEVNVVGHTHPTSVLSLVCLDDARDLCDQRLFPDEIVCCGPATVWVPYVDPGLPLAKAIRSAVVSYVDWHTEIPKIIWMQNHGLIALGRNTSEVEAATRMADKAARVWLGILASGKKAVTLSKGQIDRIHKRPDEHERQKLLWSVKQG